MPTYYVEDYDGERNDDAVPATPAETDASFVEDVTAKVVEPEAAATPQKTSRAKTKG